MSDHRGRVALIGFGAIGRTILHRLSEAGDGISIGAVLHRTLPRQDDAPSVSNFTSIADLLSWGPSLVVECAGHGAVRDLVPSILSEGIDVVVASVGALADAEIESRIHIAASTGGAQAILVSGAIGGIDALNAARLAGLESVEYVGRKPPRAWVGSIGEYLASSADDRTVVLFDGTAREAAKLYPKNANVTATVALSGMGFERTRVRLMADPGVDSNVHEIEAIGAFGRLALRLENAALPDNPRSSYLAALSVESAIRRHFASVVL
jgi:aspartate dehydrogenase